MKWPWSKIDKTANNEALDINDERLYEKLMEDSGFTSSAGPVVSSAKAMKFSAVYACVSLISGTIASLPCGVYESTEYGSKPSPGHPLHKLLHNAPDKMVTSYVFWETISLHKLLTGNAYALIWRYKDGRPKAICLLDPNKVTPKYSANFKQLFYEITLLDGRTVAFSQDDVLHFPGIGWDGLKGMSPIKAARDAIGLGLAGEEYNSKFFTNGIKSDLSISFPKALGEERAKKFRKYLHKRYGGVGNSHLPLVLTEGAEVSSLAMNAEDIQLLGSREFQIEDICRFYGVPLHMVSSIKKSSSWGSGIEQQTMGFVTFTLRRDIKRLEQEVNRKLIRSPKFMCKFNLDALLRGDTKTRGEFYKAMIGGNQQPGCMTPNEVRALQNLPPLDGGDRLYWPPENENEKQSEE